MKIRYEYNWCSCSEGCCKEIGYDYVEIPDNLQPLITSIKGLIFNLPDVIQVLIDTHSERTLDLDPDDYDDEQHYFEYFDRCGYKVL